MFPNIQLKLSAKVQKEIISEQQTMPQLQEILDVVEIVMGFLSSGGANAKKSLKDYIKTTLKMEHKFSSTKASLISFSVLYFCIQCTLGSLEESYVFYPSLMLCCVCVCVCV